MLGFDPKPAIDRAAITLDADALPALDGRAFDEAWVLSLDFIPGFRPAVGEEVPPDRIRGWQVLRIGFMEPR